MENRGIPADPVQNPVQAANAGTAGSAKATFFPDAITRILDLPLTPDEKAEAIRRLLQHPLAAKIT